MRTVGVKFRTAPAQRNQSKRNTQASRQQLCLRKWHRFLRWKKKLWGKMFHHQPNLILVKAGSLRHKEIGRLMSLLKTTLRPSLLNFSSNMSRSAEIATVQEKTDRLPSFPSWETRPFQDWVEIKTGPRVMPTNKVHATKTGKQKTHKKWTCTSPWLGILLKTTVPANQC